MLSYSFVRASVRPFVHPSIRPSIRLSVHCFDLVGDAWSGGQTLSSLVRSFVHPPVRSSFEGVRNPCRLSSDIVSSPWLACRLSVRPRPRPLLPPGRSACSRISLSSSETHLLANSWTDGRTDGRTDTHTQIRHSSHPLSLLSSPFSSIFLSFLTCSSPAPATTARRRKYGRRRSCTGHHNIMTFFRLAFSSPTRETTFLASAREISNKTRRTNKTSLLPAQREHTLAAIQYSKMFVGFLDVALRRCVVFTSTYFLKLS